MGSKLMTPKDPTFYQAAKKWVMLACDLATETLKKGVRLPTYTAQRHIVEGCGNCRTEYITVNSSYELISRIDDELQTIQEFIECKIAMESNPVIAKHLTQSVGFWNCRGPVTTEGCLTNLLEKQVDRLYSTNKNLVKHYSTKCILI